MESLLRLALKEAEAHGASDAEVYAAVTKESEVFIENNDLKQAKTQKASAVGIRVFLNGALGFYSVNSLDPDKIRNAVYSAVKIARVSPRDKLNFLPAKSKVGRVRGIYDRNAESFEAREAAKLAAEMLKTAKSHDKKVSVDSGNFSATGMTHWLANTNGVLLSEKLSVFSWSIMGMAIDGDDVSSFDVQSGGTHHVKDIEVHTAASEFARTVAGSLGAKKMTDSFKGEMLLTPAAAMEMVEEVVAHSINSDAVQKKSSMFAGKLGKRVASAMLAVEDDATNADGLAAASFDREGVPHRKNVVIENGVLKKFLYNTYTAKKAGTRSTGNASGSTSSPPSVATTNFAVKPGKSSLDGLISEIKQGVMISRFSGNVNPVNGDFSGVVKGGWLVRNGELVHPVKEVMVAGNVFDCLKNLTGLSKERKVIGASILPYMRFGRVSFTAG
ncbi:putative Zn-dependent protease-like protein [Candidatus Nitrososphaera evergladensis SR1]|jgi:PmbA protein|uniref:Putative Zn-dependent protease-like protein n=1 Tax=Candidatus Nitrososphaera evergladensis SR1 TaxID=1459636 RepID=A0A075MZE9_9ARCH|nr:TldD/PmbA family protein [Candidatus Nitrososphaera evergladensis]AIF84624.1 putative Zn-dependent protease-like protein [Candidatus Nitrososphaera evergladensis SR1]